MRHPGIIAVGLIAMIASGCAQQPPPPAPSSNPSPPTAKSSGPAPAPAPSQPSGSAKERFVGSWIKTDSDTEVILDVRADGTMTMSYPKLKVGGKMVVHNLRYAITKESGHKLEMTAGRNVDDQLTSVELNPDGQTFAGQAAPIAGNWKRR